jgi:hypothetical protein
MRPAGDNGRRRVGRHYSPRIALSPHCFHPRDARCTPWWITGRGADQRAATGDISVGRRIGSVRRSRSSRVLLVRRKRDDSTPYGNGPQCRFCISSHASTRHRPTETIVDPLTVAFGVAVARRRRAMGISWRELGTRCRVSEHRSQRRARLREQSTQYYRARRAGVGNAAIATDPRG